MYFWGKAARVTLCNPVRFSELIMIFSRLIPWMLVLGLYLIPTKGENILVFHSMGSYSHSTAMMTLVEELSNRGHEITYISAFQSVKANPKVIKIVPAQVEELVDKVVHSEFDITVRVQNKMAPMLDFVMDYGYDTCELMYTSPEFKNWLSTTKKVDLVFVDNCYAECGVGLAHKLGAKSVIFTTIAALPYEHDAYGYIPESSAIPEMETYTPTVPMGFFTRISNALMSLRWYHQYSLYSQRVDNLIRTSLQMPEMPYIGELISKVNLIFYTGDVITDYPRALPPNFVNIAGIHCKESTNALPKNIESFISPNGTRQEENDGFVYISLGSVAVSSKLPDSIKQVFFQTIRSFPKLKFLWKWNGDFPKDIPENLFLAKWFPQVDILAHKKIRAFVTQSGRPSTYEALFNGVPLISFPILGDQDFNANRLEEVGAAVKLEIGSVTLNEMKDAIKKTVYDPRTKARLVKLQNAFKDKPMTPLETAVWWTEYLLRTEDTTHLLPAGRNQSWFVRRQIDVWAFLSVSIFIAVISSIAIIGKVIGLLLKKQPKLKNA